LGVDLSGEAGPDKPYSDKYFRAGIGKVNKLEIG